MPSDPAHRSQCRGASSEEKLAIIYVLIALVALGLLVLGSSVRVITQFERGVVLRLGRLRASTRGPGLALIAPVVDRLHGCGGVAAQGRHVRADLGAVAVQAAVGRADVRCLGDREGHPAHVRGGEVAQPRVVVRARMGAGQAAYDREPVALGGPG